MFAIGKAPKTINSENCRPKLGSRRNILANAKSKATTSTNTIRPEIENRANITEAPKRRNPLILGG